jgi:hypothetical protein
VSDHEIFQDGKAAAREGKTREANPYQSWELDHLTWDAGYRMMQTLIEKGLA